MKLVSFSNKRPVQAEQGSFLTVSPTEGKVRITGVVAKSLGVVAGDYVAVAADSESKKIFIYKGIKNEKTQVGNKLAEAGANFEFGSKNVWEELGGNTDKSIKFEVSETATPFEDMELFELSNPQTKDKVVREKKEGEEKEEVVTETTVEPTAVEASEEEGFSLE